MVRTHSDVARAIAPFLSPQSSNFVSKFWFRTSLMLVWVSMGFQDLCFIPTLMSFLILVSGLLSYSVLALCVDICRCVLRFCLSLLWNWDCWVLAPPKAGHMETNGPLPIWFLALSWPLATTAETTILEALTMSWPYLVSRPGWTVSMKITLVIFYLYKVWIIS